MPESTLAKMPERDVLANAHRRADRATGDLIRDVIRLPGDQLFYLKREAGHAEFKLVTRHGLAGTERVLVDPEELTKAKGVPHAVNYFVPSWDGKLLAYGMSAGGSEDASLHVLDVASGKALGEPIPRVHESLVNWTPDSRALSYNQIRDLPADTAPTETFLDSTVFLLQAGADPRTAQAAVRSAGQQDLQARPARRRRRGLRPEQPLHAGAHHRHHGARRQAVHRARGRPWASRRRTGAGSARSMTASPTCDCSAIRFTCAPTKVRRAGAGWRWTWPRAARSPIAKVVIEQPAEGVLKGLVVGKGGTLYARDLHGVSPPAPGASPLGSLRPTWPLGVAAAPSRSTIRSRFHRRVDARQRMDRAGEGVARHRPRQATGRHRPAAGPRRPTWYAPTDRQRSRWCPATTACRCRWPSSTAPTSMLDVPHPTLWWAMGPTACRWKPSSAPAAWPGWNAVACWPMPTCAAAARWVRSGTAPASRRPSPTPGKTASPARGTWSTRATRTPKTMDIWGTQRRRHLRRPRCHRARRDLFAAAIFDVGMMDTVARKSRPTASPTSANSAPSRTRRNSKALLEMSTYHQIKDGVAYPAVMLMPWHQRPPRRRLAKRQGRRPPAGRHQQRQAGAVAPGRPGRPRGAAARRRSRRASWRTSTASCCGSSASCRQHSPRRRHNRRLAPELSATGAWLARARRQSINHHIS